MQVIRQITTQPELYTIRAAIARAVCMEMAWLRPDARLKDMSAKVALLRMHRNGIITRPPPWNTNSTTTRQGLTVHAEQDTRQYPPGVKVSDEDMKKSTPKA